VEWSAQPGTHDLSARATDELGNFSDSKPVTVFVKGSESKDAGNGLKAEYFPNKTLAGTPVEAVAETIDFDWTERPPAEGIPHRGFSARFSGKLLPRASGFHSLILRHAGGVRVWLNGEQIIDNWNEPVLPSGEFAFSEGGAELLRGEPVDLVVEYFDENAHGYLKMIWFEPDNFNENLVPQSQLYLPEQSVTAFGISTASRIPNRRFGQRLRVALTTTRGIAPVTWSLVGGSLPDGVTLNPAGSLNGASSEGGRFTFRLRAEDGNGASAERTFSMLVTSPVGQTNGPVVKFTRPSPGANVESRAVTIAGTFSGAADLLSLEYSLNRGLRHPIPASRNWSVVLDSIRGVVAGENTVQLYAVDADGREASSQVLKFRLRFKSPLNVSIDGSGSISPGFLGTTTRYVGDQFSITAKPAPGWIFSHWEPSFASAPTLVTKMEENLGLVAVFIQNPFIPFAGKYTGLIGENRRQARYDLTISKYGAFTMVLFIDGVRKPISGRITPNGTFDSYQDSDSRLPNYLGLILRFDIAEVRLSVQFYNFDFFEVFESVALRANWQADCPAAGAWTLQLASPSEDFPGSGYAKMNIGKNGTARLVGKTSDGTSINAGLRVAEDTSIPFYTPVGDSGTLVGAMNYVSQRGRRINGNLHWFSGSIDEQTSAEGAPFSAPRPGSPVFLLPNGEGIFIHRAPSPTFFTGATLSPLNKFVFSTPGIAAPVLVVDPKTGLVTGSYTHPETRKRVKLHGVVNQLTNTATGIITGESPGGFTVGPRGW
jgi:hypothetical protein